jgi:uncharacterized membrane protein
MVARLLKLLHYGALIGFIGGLAAALLLAAFAADAPPTAHAALRMAIAHLGAELVVPALVLLVVSGLLLVVARPHLIGARWIWAKAVLTLALGGVTLVVVMPALQRAAAVAAQAAIDAAPPGDAAHLFAAEAWGGTAVLLLALVAVILAVWRPRLGAQPAADEPRR